MTDEWRARCRESWHGGFGEGSGETCCVPRDPELSANATRSAPTLHKCESFSWVGIDSGLVAEENHDRVGSRVERPDACAVRRGAPGAEDGVFNHLRISEDDLLTYLFNRAAQNDDHLIKPRRSLCLIDDPAEQRASSERQKLFGLPEAA